MQPSNTTVPTGVCYPSMRVDTSKCSFIGWVLSPIGLFYRLGFLSLVLSSFGASQFVVDECSPAFATHGVSGVHEVVHARDSTGNAEQVFK